MSFPLYSDKLLTREVSKVQGRTSYSKEEA